MPYVGRDLQRGNYLKLDDISSSFNGSLTTFNLTSGGNAFFPGSAFSIIVSLGGVVQEPESAFQIDRSQIIFATAPTSSSDFFCIALGVALGVGVPGHNTVNNDQLAKPLSYGDYFRWDSANNRVGINTLLPSTALDVVGSATFSGNVSIGGTLTYEDVANIDAVGIITARAGIEDKTLTAGRVVYAGTGGRLVDNANLTFDGTDVGIARSIFHLGDTDTNIGFFSTDALSVNTGGVERLRVTNNQVRVLDVPLTIARSTVAGNSDLNFGDSADGDTGLIRYRHDDNFMSFSVAGTSEKVRIRSDGNIGINTTIPTKLVTIKADAPFVRLEAQDGSDKRLDFEVTNTGIATISATQSSQQLSFRTTSGEAIRIQSDGDVGIGTDSPEANFRLTVQGDLSLGEKSGTDNTYLDQKQNGDFHIINSGRGADGVSGNITGGAGGVGINRYNTIAGGTTYFRDFAVYNGKSTKVLVVDGSASKVGIGTDTPARSLDVRGGTNGNHNSRVFRLATADNGKRVDFSYERDGFLSINNGISDAALLLIGEDGDILIDRTSKLANAKLSINQDSAEEGIGLQLNTSSGITTAFTFYNSSGTNIGQVSLKTDSTPDILFKIKHSSDSVPVEKVKFTSAGNVYQTGSSYTIDSAASAQFILDRGNTSSGATVDLRTAGSTKWYFGMRGLVNDNFYIRNESGSTDPFTILSNGNVGINDTSPSFNLEVGGSFAATTKSFVINHPTKEKHKLRYACLEGPENSVYVRGKTSDSVIELPDYWTGLVHDDSITVNVTPIGNHKVWVESINNNSVTIGSDGSEYFYTVFAERKDVDKLEVEVAD